MGTDLTEFARLLGEDWKINLTEGLPRRFGAGVWFEGNGVSVFETRLVNPEFAFLDLRSSLGPKVGEIGVLYWVTPDAIGSVRASLRAHYAAQSGRQRFVFALEHAGLEAARAFSRWLNQPEYRERRSWLQGAILTDPSQIAHVIDRLTVMRVEGSCAQGSLFMDAQPLLLERDAAEQLQVTGPVLAEAGVQLAEFALRSSIYTVPLMGLRRDGTGQVCSSPPWLSRRSLRRLQRGGVPAGCRVEFVHPLFSDLRVERELLEVSLRGLSLRASPTLDLLYVGMRIDGLRVHFSGQRPIALNARVCSIRERDSAELQIIGLELEPASDEDRLRWERQIELLLYPDTTTRGRLRLWSVFEQAGYFRLSGKTESDFDQLRSAHRRSAGLLARSPNLGCTVSWPAAGRPRATISHLRAYSRAWLISQLSKARESDAPGASDRRVLEHLYKRAYEHALAQDGTTWFLQYVKADAPRWSRQLHENLPRSLAERGDACVLPFQAWQLDANCGLEQTPEYTIAKPSAAELDNMVQVLAALRPRAYCEALDLISERLSWQSLGAEYGAARLQRKRELFVARAAGEMVGFAIAELAEPGLHLFRLLDCVRIFSSNHAHAAAVPALLEGARQWFRANDRECFLYFEEAELAGLAGIETKASDLGRAWTSIFHARHMPEFIEQMETQVERSTLAR